MSISFSGLASGLDTSSWVDSLTALKRAKVEVYQAEKEKVLLSQNTLNSIKSFFSSFRATIEKITDTKFGIASMDLFSQKLATSSNLNVLTATATNEAEEATYDINIKNLATKTQASSKYSYTKTTTVTATATLDSSLSSLGVKAGNIGVTVNGIENTINITNSETLQSFTNKLKDIGADAKYNNRTGKFTVNLGASAFNDIDNTGIKEALHLTDVNTAYKTDPITLKKTETVYNVATRDTKLSELGVNDGIVKFESNSTPSQIEITKDTTIGNLVDSLNSNGISANFSDDGYFTIQNAVISDDGDTNLIDVLGLQSPTVNSSHQTSKPLSYNSTISETTVATGSTLLKDLGDGISINDGDTVIVADSANNQTTITVSSTTTIDELVGKLQSAGLTANFDGTNGIVSIGDGSIVGGTFDIKSALKLEETINGKYATSTSVFVTRTTAIDMTSSDALTYKEDRYATVDDKVYDFIDDSYKSASGFDVVIEDKIPDAMGASKRTIKVDGTTTFSELFDKLAAEGITAEITDGVINFNNTGDSYIESGLEGLGINTVTTTVSATQTIGLVRTSDVLTFNEFHYATGDDKIYDFNYINDINSEEAIVGILDSATGSVVAEDYRIDENTTFNELFSYLAQYDIEASIEDGVISISNNGDYYWGDPHAWTTLANRLGIYTETSSSSSTVTVGTTVTSPTLGTSLPLVPKSSDKISTYVNIGTGTNMIYLTHMLSDAGQHDDSFNVDENTTFQTLFDKLAGFGIEASLTDDGRISIDTSNSVYYIANESLGAELGIESVVEGTTKDIKVPTNISSGILSYESVVTPKLTDKVSDFVELDYTNDDTHSIFIEQKGYDDTSGSNWTNTDYAAYLVVDENTTFQDIFNKLAEYGINATLNDGVISVDNAGGHYLQDGGLAGQLGMDMYHSGYVTILDRDMSPQLKYHTTQVATMDDKIADFVDLSGNSRLEYVYAGPEYTDAPNDRPTESFIDLTNATFGQLASWLDAFGGISLSIADDGSLIIDNNGSDVVLKDFEPLGIHSRKLSSGYYSNYSDVKMTKWVEAGVATLDTTLGELYENPDDCFYKLTDPPSSSDGYQYFGETMTIGEALDYLKWDGINATFSNGYIIIDPADVGRIADINLFGFKTREVLDSQNNDSNNLSKTVEAVADRDTLMSEVGTGQIFIKNIGTQLTYIVTASADKTVGQVIDELKAHGMRVNFSSDGEFEILGDYDDTSYVKSFNGAFGLTGGNYEVKSVHNVNNSSSIKLTKEAMNYGIMDSTKMSQINNGSAVGTITVNYMGEEHTVTATGDKTAAEVCAELSALGISTNLRNDGDGFGMSYGKLTFSGSEDAYVSDFGGAFGLTGGAYTESVSEADYTYNKPQSSSQFTISSTIAANGGNTMAEIGKEGNIVVYSNGELITVEAVGTKEIGVVCAELAGAGLDVTLNNGIISIGADIENSNAYVLDFGGAFGLTGAGYQAPSQSESMSLTSIHNTPSNTLIKTDTITVNDSTTMAQLGLTTELSQVLDPIITLNHEDTVIDLNITPDMTISELHDVLAQYDIDLIIKDGRVTLSGKDGSDIKAYIEGMDTDVSRIFKFSMSSSTDGLGETYKFVQLPLSSSWGNIYLNELKDSDGNGLGITSGNISVNRQGLPPATISITPLETLESLASKLSNYGIAMEIAGDGTIKLNSTGNSYLTTDGMTSGASNILSKLGLDNWATDADYTSSAPLQVNSSSSSTNGASNDTKLSDLGITSGEYYLYSNGVKNTLNISSGDTVETLINTLASHGVNAELVNVDGKTLLTLSGSGNSYIAASTNAASRSNIATFFNNASQSYDYGSKQLQVASTQTSYEKATEDTLLSEFDRDGLKTAGQLEVTVGGRSEFINIGVNDTIGDLLGKFRDLGFDAEFINDEILISDPDSILTFKNSSSDIVGLLGFQFYNGDLTGYAATAPDETVQTIHEVVEKNTGSVANYANDDTKLSLLNISSGTLTLYRDGEKAVVQVDKNQTFGDLKAKIAAQLSDVSLTFDNGYLTIASNKKDSEVVVGATTDTSNFSAITGVTTANGKAVSSRALYCVNGESIVTNSGLFVAGQVAEGDFYVGNARIEINDKTTINDIISQINYSDESGATAYWDTIEGKFVVKAKNTGASLVNIEAGTSNFTDIMGFTYEKDGISRMDVSTQEVGENARFSINGTNFVSASNTVNSDVTRIKGVTLNLKDISKDGESVTLTIEKDKETIATAVADVVDAYNQLIENVDKEVARDGNLSGESTLRLIRNQIRSLMTSSISNTGLFKNLGSVGISLAAASSGNIRTDNINQLSFDKDKFIESFNADTNSLKSLLVGDDSKDGILTMVEKVLEQSLAGVSGYFASAEKSYATKANKLDTKIDKTNKAADRYKMRLEAKFKVMDRLISNVQNNYSSFLAS